MNIKTFKNLLVGDIVRITFLDHVEDGNDPIEFEVFGRVARNDDKSVVVRSWGLANGDIDDVKENEKVFTIVKSTVTSLKKIFRGK